MKATFFLFLLCWFCSLQLFPQKSADDVKVAVVLSGGGAKGLAHIGVLKALEDAGLYPDMITGTSMGAVIGGLYATGYSASEIEEIAKKMNWEELLSNQIPLSHVAFEEKTYYGRYVAELPVIKNKPKLPQGLIEGQKLHEELSRLTRSVHRIRNFDDLPIPYRAVATNIETGERVILSRGSLPSAIRASMAIPTIFTPVRIGDTLMVDGGLVRNFPVQEAIDMGADIVIGVFVSTDLEPLEELEDMFDILLQSSWVMSAYDSREQRKLTNIYIAPELANFGTLSFDQADSIVLRGHEAGARFQGAFTDLKDSLENLGKIFSRPKVRIATDTLQLSSIEVLGNSQISDEFIVGKLNIQPNSQITLPELSNRIERLYGTRYFKKIDYELIEDNSKAHLKINVQEVVQTRLKAAIHYNNERKVGLNMNLTIRNKLLDNSRFIAEVDIAENPRLDINYLKYTGIKQAFAATAGYSFREFELPIFSSEDQLASFKYWRNKAYLIFQNTKNPLSSGGFKVEGSYNIFQPDVADFLGIIQKGTEQSVDIQLFWNFNSTNKQFFPDAGLKGGIQIGWVPFNDLELQLALDSATSSEILRTASYENFTYLRFGMDHYLKLSDQLTTYYGLHTTLNSTSSTGLNFEGNLGGFYQNHPSIQPFWGARFYEIQVPAYSMIKMGIQWEFAESLYFLGQANYMNTKYPITLIESDFEYGNVRGRTDLFGGGLGIGYESFLGPILLNVGKSANGGDWLFGINIGFWY